MANVLLSPSGPPQSRPVPTPADRTTTTPPEANSAATRLRLLAYVHMRNIHASTGAGRVARQLTEHLVLRDDVDLTVLADARDRDRIVPLVGKPWDNFRYRTFSRDTSRQQSIWYAFNRPVAEQFAPDAQVVFCTGESYVPVRRARLAVTVHDAAYFDQGAHRRDRSFHLQRLKWSLLFRRLARRADMIHTVSNFSAERIAHHFPSLSARLRVVHNGVAPHFFGPVGEPGQLALRKAGLDGTQPFLLIPGGLHFRKNADLILAAAPRLLALDPKLLLVVVNHSDPLYQHQAAALGSRLRLLGFVSDELLHALHAAAAVVWYPSRYEGFGLPVLEAMAAGAPVVASNAASLPEIAGDAALLVDPAQPDAHVDAIAHVLSSPATRLSLREAGFRHAREFTWAAAAARLKHHFDELL